MRDLVLSQAGALKEGKQALGFVFSISSKGQINDHFRTP